MCIRDRADRGLRNALEHFDERLDLFLAQDMTGEFVPDYVDNKRRPVAHSQYIFKAFYTDDMEFVLLDESFFLSPLFQEIRDTHRRLEDCQASGHRLPYAPDR